MGTSHDVLPSEQDDSCKQVAMRRVAGNVGTELETPPGSRWIFIGIPK
jgi:hypothetical protein